MGSRNERKVLMRVLIAVTAVLVTMFLTLVLIARGSQDGRSAENALVLESEVPASEAMEVERVACTTCLVSSHPNTLEHCNHVQETRIAFGPAIVLKLPSADAANVVHLFPSEATGSGFEVANVGALR